MSTVEPLESTLKALGSLRAHVEGYPQGGRIERHVHEQDQLALISQSTAIIETDECYVVQPLLTALWLPAGVHHAVYSARPFYLHSLYFEASSVRSATAPQVLGLDALARELVMFLCSAPRASQRGPRHAHALALLMTLLADAKTESFVLPRPRSERARKPAHVRAALRRGNGAHARRLEATESAADIAHVAGRGQERRRRCARGRL